MEETKKKKNYFYILFVVLFIIFICLYLMNISGYYDVSRSNMMLTEEKIKEFERDVAKGEYVDLNDYFEDRKLDYDNNFSNISLKISDGIDTFLNRGLKGTLKALEKLFK